MQVLLPSRWVSYIKRELASRWEKQLAMMAYQQLFYVVCLGRHSEWFWIASNNCMPDDCSHRRLGENY
eukprot:765095-Pyramimonas_sp.AAC.1